jgi:hypothetical protein
VSYDKVVEAVGGVAIEDIEDIEGALAELFTVEDKSQIIYVDSSVTIHTGSSLIVDGLDHLEGQQVTIVADGGVRPPATVVGGNITLDRSATVVTVGLNYQSTLQLMPVEAGASFGTAQGKMSKIARIQVRGYQSLGFKYGPSNDKLTAYSFRTIDGQMDSPPAIRTGDMDEAFDGGFARTNKVIIVRDQPYPLNISAVMLELTVND